MYNLGVWLERRKNGKEERTKRKRKEKPIGYVLLKKERADTLFLTLCFAVWNTDVVQRWDSAMTLRNRNIS